MKAIEISSYGAPDVLRVCERAIPEARAGEVLIKVCAAGVNRPDVLQRQGYYPVPPGASDLPGLEISGEVVGGDVAGSQFEIGSQVCALVQGGGYAEYCVAPVAQCLPIPLGISMLEAASLPETYFTVWSNVFDQARLAKGESLFVQGGTSGIGVAAIQMAAALGHQVYATAGSDEKCLVIKSLGSVDAINYRTHDFEVEILRMTNGDGVNVILDMVAGSYVPRELRCLAAGGRLSIIALLGGAKAELDLGRLLRHRLSIMGSTLRNRDVVFKTAIAAQLQAIVWPLFELGKIRPVIHQIFPLDMACDAHTLMESGAHIGKIVLTA